MYWTLALSTVSVTRIKAIIGFWEWCVCLNLIFLCADFYGSLIDEAFVALSKSVPLSRVAQFWRAF